MYGLSLVVDLAALGRIRGAEELIEKSLSNIKLRNSKWFGARRRLH
jgi:hypothetical protein